MNTRKPPERATTGRLVSSSKAQPLSSEWVESTLTIANALGPETLRTHLCVTAQCPIALQLLQRAIYVSQGNGLVPQPGASALRLRI